MKFLEVNNINIVTVILVIAFIYPILMGFIFKLKSKSIVVTIKGVLTSIAIVCSILLSTIVFREVFTLDKYGLVKYVSSKISSNFDVLLAKSMPLKGVILLIVFLLIYEIFKLFLDLVNRFILYPASDAIDRGIVRSGRGSRALLGALFQIPKAACNIIIITALLSYASLFFNNDTLNRKLSDSNIYSYINKTIIRPVIESEVAKSFPKILDNSFKVVDSENNSIETVDGYLQGNILYNGVTLEDGVKSNGIIDSAALDITNGFTSKYDKSKALYQWIGSTIVYDDNKANEVMKNQIPVGINSGAINTFNTGKGVCFDYACLFVAMSRANDIPVRLIVGEGFNGISWVSHSWNEVYIEEEKRWVNVDPTFYNAGNYFDNATFNSEHRYRKIAGEFK